MGFFNVVRNPLGSQNPNSDNHSSADNAHPSSSDSPASLWPVLIHLSWDSIGYPYGSTLHQVGVSTANSSNEPTFSMALEHRQIHRLSDSGIKLGEFWIFYLINYHVHRQD